MKSRKSKRPSPADPAKEHKNKTKKGGDGCMWVSKKDSRGSYRWIRKSPNCSKKKRPAPVEKEDLSHNGTRISRHLPRDTFLRKKKLTKSRLAQSEKKLTKSYQRKSREVNRRRKANKVRKSREKELRIGINFSFIPNEWDEYEDEDEIQTGFSLFDQTNRSPFSPIQDSSPQIDFQEFFSDSGVDFDKYYEFGGQTNYEFSGIIDFDVWLKNPDKKHLRNGHAKKIRKAIRAEGHVRVRSKLISYGGERG